MISMWICVVEVVIALFLGLIAGVSIAIAERDKLQTALNYARTQEQNAGARMRAVEADLTAKLKAAEQRVRDLLGRAQP